MKFVRTICACLAGLCVLGALVFGFKPVTVSSPQFNLVGGSVDCGSAFRPDDSNPLPASVCDASDRDSNRTIAIGFAAAAVVLALLAVFLPSNPSSAPSDATADLLGDPTVEPSVPRRLSDLPPPPPASRLPTAPTAPDQPVSQKVPGGSPSALADRLAELDELKALGLVTDVEYASKRAEIIASL